MSDEKPLYVRVAEAIGARKPVDMSLFPPGCVDTYGDVPHYDTDWSATGPLIERLGFCLSHEPGWWAATTEHWRHEDAAQPYRMRRGETALLAVCNLILALKEAGKL